MTQIDQRTLTEPQKHLLGRLLLELLEGSITDITRDQIDIFDPRKVPGPFNHLVSYIQGSGQTNQGLTLTLLDEVAIICKEVKERATAS